MQRAVTSRFLCISSMRWAAFVLLQVITLGSPWDILQSEGLSIDDLTADLAERVQKDPENQ